VTEVRVAGRREERAVASTTTESAFPAVFAALTGNSPFPWQQELYGRFVAGNFPASCNLPTGLGKTSIIHVWLIALATAPTEVPRRLVYVVNRRTVVDQATREAEKLRKQLLSVPHLAASLENLCAVEADPPLAISTLRGEFADNREWRSDPARPAVVVGTVDMIGSRLLFSGYGCGFKSRPLHAGFLGQDVLLVHDEAHLEPAFQKLLKAIENEQARCGEFRRFRVMELTATSRSGEGSFGLTPADVDDETVKKRIRAKKRIELREVDDEKKTADAVVKLALAHEGSSGAILIFLRKVEDVEKVASKLPKGRIERLTGTLRGKERDGLIDKQVFQQFLPPSDRRHDFTPAGDTVYLVCTSAGEVGVNISADHLVCDLTPFDSMAQRFGRVNRFGDGDARIDIVYPNALDESKPLEAARKKTLARLRELPSRGENLYDGSPSALGGLLQKLTADQICSLYTPHLSEPPTSEILFDHWALTSVRDLPGRPPVDDYLHGPGEETADTYFAWRQEVQLLDFLPTLPNQKRREREVEIEEYLDEYPLKPHELLRERTAAVIGRHLKEFAKRGPDLAVWVIDGRDALTVMTIAELAEHDFRQLVGRTLVLPPVAGGLRGGMLDGKVAFTSDTDYDVADAFPGESGRLRVRFVWIGGPAQDEEEDGSTNESSWRLIGNEPKFTKRPEHGGKLRVDGHRYVRLPDQQLTQDEEGNARRLVAFVRTDEGEDDETRSRQSSQEQQLNPHLAAAERFAAAITEKLNLPDNVRTAVALAARWHDLGKDRHVWQLGIDNTEYPSKILAKSGHGRRIKALEGYRHEFGSLLDVETLARFAQQQSPDVQDIILHLIAVHHGFGRPYFPVDKAFDPERSEEERPFAEVGRDVVQRTARLQRRYGRWGLTYLESLLRAADVLASDLDRVEHLNDLRSSDIEKPRTGSCDRPLRPLTADPTIMVKVDSTNPGQFFACCGLLELADRLWGGAKGWFGDGKFYVADGGTLRELLTAVGTSELGQLDPGDDFSSPIELGPPFRLRLDWWTDERAGGKALKVWAGSMRSVRIARAMRHALLRPELQEEGMFDRGMVVLDPTEPDKKVEPYYFDGRRGANAQALDIGFAPDALHMTTAAYPAVEFLCLVGLQRCRPRPTDTPRVFDYYTWSIPLEVPVLPASVCGLLGGVGGTGYRFENAFRTDQRKHKAFLPSIRLGGDP
jgi:CRISPR-associated endonuclease/helicase Cas3